MKFHELTTKKWAGRIPWEEIGNQGIFSYGAENTCPENNNLFIFYNRGGGQGVSK